MPSRTITSTGAELVPENRLRKSLVIQNEDTTIDTFIKQEKPGATTISITDHDHRIPRESLMSINSDTDGIEQIQGRWTIVAASGAPRVSFFETEDVRR